MNMYRIAFASTSVTMLSSSTLVLSSTTLDCRDSSFKAPTRLVQPPYESDKAALSAEPAKTVAKCLS